MAFPREKLFGDDLLLVERANGFDLTRDAQGDLALAQGVDNLVQALKLRLLVHKGELTRLGFPEYGSRLHELIGEPNNTRTHIKLMSFARSAIEADPRVVEVAEMHTQVLLGERAIVRLIMDVVVISQPNPLNLVLDLDLEAL